MAFGTGRIVELEAGNSFGPRPCFGRREKARAIVYSGTLGRRNGRVSRRQGHRGQGEGKGIAAFARTESGEPGTLFSPSEAARYYSPLGAWKGPLAARDVEDESLHFWRSSGDEGVRWLIHRLGDEFHLETLHGVASLLADLGEIILAPVFPPLFAPPSSPFLKKPPPDVGKGNSVMTPDKVI